MPSVLVVPIYVEIPDGVERAVMALESHLRRAGYVFHTGEPRPENSLEDKLPTLNQRRRLEAEISP